MEKILSQLKPKEKLALMFNLQHSNKHHDQYLTRTKFLQAVHQVAKVKTIFLEELFETFAERYSS